MPSLCRCCSASRILCTHDICICSGRLEFPAADPLRRRVNSGCGHAPAGPQATLLQGGQPAAHPVPMPQPSWCAPACTPPVGSGSGEELWFQLMVTAMNHADVFIQIGANAATVLACASLKPSELGLSTMQSSAAACNGCARNLRTADPTHNLARFLKRLVAVCRLVSAWTARQHHMLGKLA